MTVKSNSSREKIFLTIEMTFLDIEELFISGSYLQQ